jgi:hypothetical protein
MNGWWHDRVPSLAGRLTVTLDEIGNRSLILVGFRFRRSSGFA